METIYFLLRRMRVKYILVCWVLLSTASGIKAQDTHTSQFYSVPSQINPAFTGFFANDYYAAAAYKTQWRSISTPYQTMGGTAEISLLKNKRPNSIIGVGTSVIHDKSGSINFTTDAFNLNVSYLQVLDVNRRHTIGVGFQNSLNLRKFDLSKATFGNQYNGYDGFDQGINPNENGLSTRQLDYNLAIGGLYSFAPKEHANLYLSVSAFNLVRPNVSFYKDSEDRLYTRLCAFVGGEVPLKGNWSMLPSALFQIQGPHKEIMLGTFIRYGLVKTRKERLGINVGVWYRYMDAVIPAVKMEYKGMNITFNYDINVSKLTKVSKFNGSAEISISYSGLLFKEHKKPAKPMFCPAFAY